MSIGQIFPSSTFQSEEKNEYKTGLESLKMFNTIRQSRHTSKETTIIIQSPKNATSQRALITPKRSQFTSQDQIVEEDDLIHYGDKTWKKKFDAAAKRLAILLQFFRYLKHSLSWKKSQIKKVHKKKSKLPFYPNELQFWKSFMMFQTSITLIIYPVYISFFISNNLDTLSIIILVLDGFYLIDIFLKQISCQIDKNYNLLSSYKEIFVFNLQRWLIFDILSILPYKLFVDNIDDLLILNLLKLLRFVKYFTYSERLIYQETSNKKDTIDYFDKLFTLDGKILSILKIFKNMLILVNLFGCLFNLVLEFGKLVQYKDFISNYIQGLYWAIQTVTVIGYGDIMVTTSLYYDLTIIWNFIGVGFYSFTIGNLAAILDQEEANEEYDEDLELLEQLVQKIVIPDELTNAIFSFFQYNIENNPFWNYKKIIETFPSHLKVFAISFCCKQLIENVNIFAVDINFAAAVLPYFSINCFKQYETIYLSGSPSLEVFFLVAGEVRLCDNEGNTLLNIQEGHIFGEIEILEDNYRRFAANASKDSIVIMCPIYNFLELVSQNETLLFEIEQLGLRRRLLLQENQALIKKLAKQVRRASHVAPIMTPYIAKKQLLERQFKRNIIKESHQQIHKKLMRYVFGQKQEKKWKYQAIFKMAVRKILDVKKQMQKSQRRTSLIMGKQMMHNFENVREEEKNIQKKLWNNSKDGKHQKRVKIKDILNKHRVSLIAPMLITTSPYFSEIRNEAQEEKMLIKQKRNQILELSNRLIKIDMNGQLKIIDTMYEDLLNQIEILNENQFEAYEIQEDMESLYFQISVLISSII